MNHNYRKASLSFKVNIIPVIAKADTINKNELAKFKAKIMSELKNNGVSIYQVCAMQYDIGIQSFINNWRYPLKISFFKIAIFSTIPAGLGTKKGGRGE